MDVILQLFHDLKEIFSHHHLFALGILLIAGYSLGKLAALIKLPEITGFIIAGLIIGEAFTGVIAAPMAEDLKLITEVALGLIALTIGGEFYWVKLKRMGKEVVIITLIQLLFAALSVTLGLWLLKMRLPFALLMGAIASATAPAATVAIVQSLRAHGKFIDYLYGVVALDDAGAVILFGIIFAAASSMLGIDINASQGMGGIIVHALSEVFFSIFVGIISGFFIHWSTRKKKNPNEILIISLGIIFLSTAFAIVFHLSPLLVNMAAGAMIINLSAKNHRIFKILEPLAPPIYALFFVMAGIELKPQILFNPTILLLGSTYILLRALGKYSGVLLGCQLSKTEDPIKKYLGLCMFPQAGVAIGLVLLIQASPLASRLSQAQLTVVDNMVNIVLLSVFINELIGPLISRYAIIKGNKMEE